MSDEGLPQSSGDGESRLSDRVVARFRLRARLRLRWLLHLWEQMDALEVALLGTDSAAAEAAWHVTEPESQRLLTELKAVENALESSSRLKLLEQIFSLDPAESDVLQACFAVAVEPSLLRVCAHLQDDTARTWLTEGLVARLYGPSARGVSPESPLRRWELVRSEVVLAADSEALLCDPLIRDWLLGDNRLDEALVGVASLRRPHAPLPSWPVAACVADVSRLLQDGERVRVCIAGAPGTGRTSFAAAAARGLELPLLVVEMDRVDEAWPTVFRRAQRQAFLDRCAIAWVGETGARRPWFDVPTCFPLQFLITDVAQSRPAAPMMDVAIELPPLSIDERRELWQRLVPGAEGWPEAAVEELAARFRVPVRDIAAAARRRVESPEAAAALVREASRTGLGELATWLDCPFSTDDLVLPESLRRGLGELTFEARERAAFWEETSARRLFPQGRGLVALFTGTPGTGKTMAAQVLAASLGVDLFRISLSSVVSKYVGETSQNLERVLRRAEHMDAVLLFDEADALFGKRTEIKDAHDRFANTDTNHLLIAIESYRGIAILASNKRANIDAAFVRRLRYVFEFPRPDAAQRLQIWRRLTQEMLGAEPAASLDAVLGELAQAIETSGAEIKYALLAAMFIARQQGGVLDRDQLLRGLDRELSKDGRGLNERDKQAIARAARAPEGRS